MSQLQASQCIPLQPGIVYGPIASRRLGTSLGINPLPVSYKLCSSNCVYCQYDWTTNENLQGERLPTAEQIIAATTERCVQAVAAGQAIDWITLAGNGEPTLHPALGEIVEGLLELRNRHAPSARVGILSDATTVHRERVRAALGALDERFMKLDVGTPDDFARINQPMGQVDWDRMIEGLRTLPDVTLQSMFITGTLDNSQPEHVRPWLHVVDTIQPKGVQVYTLDRPPADQGLRPVSQARLAAIGEQLQRETGIPAEVF